ncbi:SH3 domain protein [Gammaproteobacteria bacterium]
MYRLIACLLFALPFTAATAGSVRYVTDNLTVPMRTGVTLQHKILKMVPSGTAVEVLEVSSENTRVKAQGIEGWILNQFLDNTPPARNRLEQAEQKVATLELENTRLKSEVKGVTDQRGQTEGAYQKLREDNQRLRSDLDTLRQTAANAIEINDQNQQLKARLIELERTLQTLQQESVVLKDRTARDWFATGAAVALASLVVSLFVPRMVRWRRRSQWDTL